MSIEKHTFESSSEKTQADTPKTENETHLEDYANFKDTEANLPVKGINFETVHSGSFSSVIPLDNDRILKINRAQERYGQEEYLVKKTSNKDADRKGVIESMQQLANEKRKNYDLLQNYISEYIPKLELLMIAESPRKQLEEVMGDVAPEVLKRIPQTEITLLEVWETAHPEFEMLKLDYGDLERILEQSQNKKFAPGVSRLLFEHRKLLDISDDAGIPTVTRDGSHGRARELDETMEVLVSEDVIAYPRNTTAANDKLVFYDLYPLFDVPKEISNETIKQIALLVGKNDVHALRRVVEEDPKSRESRLNITRYLTLLKRMGANLEEN